MAPPGERKARDIPRWEGLLMIRLDDFEPTAVAHTSVGAPH
jgi:hypothetical protein